MRIELLYLSLTNQRLLSKDKSSQMVLWPSKSKAIEKWTKFSISNTQKHFFRKSNSLDQLCLVQMSSSHFPWPNCLHKNGYDVNCHVTIVKNSYMLYIYVDWWEHLSVL